MIRQTVTRQANQVFSTFLQAVEHCPEEEFQLGAEHWQTSIGDVAMHAAGSVEHAFHTAAFQAKWTEPVSSKAECIAYIASCQEDLLLPYIQSESLSHPDPHPEYFVSRLDRVMKTLRHLAHHTGEINLLLSQAGHPTARYM